MNPNATSKYQAYKSFSHGSVDCCPLIASDALAKATMVAEYGQVTVFVHGAISSFVGYQAFEASRVVIKKLPYAQYASAILVSQIPRGKRKLKNYIETANASTVVVDGWGHPPLPSSFGPGGTARHPAFDEQWDAEFGTWLNQLRSRSGVAVLIDLRGHDAEEAKHPPPSLRGQKDTESIPISRTSSHPLAMPPAAILLEGAPVDVVLSTYERNPAARAACLSHYGLACKVCGADFEMTYGDLGRGFIHVHHLNPLSSDANEHSVDPINDLRPVCPNCHAMLHRRDPPITIEGLRALITCQRIPSSNRPLPRPADPRGT